MKRGKTTILLTIFTILVLIISGCSSKNQEVNTETSESQAKLENETITIEHSLGETMVKKTL